MDFTRLLNSLHALTHARSHLAVNEGFHWFVVRLLTERQFTHIAVWWCPVCTGTALWIWLIKNKVYYGT